MTGRQSLVTRIARAEARATVSGRPAVVTLAAPAQDADPLAVLAEAGPPFAYFELPHRGFSMAALGAAHAIEPCGDPDRFRSTSAALRDLATRTHPVAFDGVERGPLLVGGFSFQTRSAWPGFPAGRLVLPDLALIRRDRTAPVWIAASGIAAGDDPVRLADTLIDRVETARAGRFNRVEPARCATSQDSPPDLPDPSFLEKVAEAVDAIRRGGLEKVVLARRVRVDRHPSPGSLLADLRRIYQTCAIFAFGEAGGSVFCGATPELLARVRGVTVSALALAGTAPRGADPVEDERLAARLRDDPKEVAEHRLVHSELIRRLEGAGFALGPPAPTGMVRLAGIQHLSTPVTAVAPVGTNVLDVVGALHPTPAVAGLPGDRASEWIGRHEGFDRGWYAGPVGFCDLAGAGEFHMALRCCLIRGGRTSLFAGAGILAGSIPQSELEETNLKLGAILPSVLG